MKNLNKKYILFLIIILFLYYLLWFNIKNQHFKNIPKKDNLLYISGWGFSRLCNLTYCNRYDNDYNNKKIINVKENDKVFLNLEMFKKFIKFLDKNKPIKKFILISHNCDSAFTEKHYKLLEKYVTKVYAINNECGRDNVITIPIGFRDYPKNTYEIIKSIKLERNKNILCYQNYVINTNKIVRTEWYNKFSKKNWILTIDENQRNKDNIDEFKFYKHLSNSKYVLSPQGEGIDCHRIYESIYFDSIPILKKGNKIMDKFYKKLPIIMVDDLNLITEDFLTINYKKNLSKLKKWKQDNSDWVNPNYWII